MFKKTSENMQFHETQAAINSTHNSVGVDPSLWKEFHTEREIFIVKLKQLQDNATKLTQQIAEAKARYSGYIKKPAVPYDTVLRWERDKAANAQKIYAVQAKLTELRRKKQITHEEQDMTFERTFMAVAKEILVEEAFNRILIATIHRTKEREKTQ